MADPLDPIDTRTTTSPRPSLEAMREFLTHEHVLFVGPGETIPEGLSFKYMGVGEGRALYLNYKADDWRLRITVDAEGRIERLECLRPLPRRLPELRHDPPVTRDKGPV